MELRVGSRYRLGRKIGSGSFGDIYLGKILKFPCTVRFFIQQELEKNESFDSVFRGNIHSNVGYYCHE